MGLSEMPSPRALLRIVAGGRCIFRLMTPVGVLPLASSRSIFTSPDDQGSRERRLHQGFVLRGPFLPMGEIAVIANVRSAAAIAA